MIYRASYIFYLLSLLFACFCGIYRFKTLDISSRILAVLVCCAFINESAAYYLAKRYHNNLAIYNIYCLIEYVLLCLYFNNVIDVFIKNNTGIYIGIAGAILGILNVIFIQNLYSFNSYFLFFEDLVVIGMSLFAFFRLLLKHDSFHLHKYHHFWFISILIFFWSITFLTWGLYDYINMKLQHEAWKINFTLVTVGSITYSCFGCVFLLYPKMQTNNE
jgi:hypothetical protein